jgi:hypothetical protein
MFARLFAKTLELELNLKTNSAAAVLDASAAPVYALSAKLFLQLLSERPIFILVTSAVPLIGQVLKAKCRLRESICAAPNEVNSLMITVNSVCSLAFLPFIGNVFMGQKYHPE